jgi:threonine synthase
MIWSNSKGFLSSFTFSDAETLEAMKTIYHTVGYIVEPHGAVIFGD